MNPDLEKAPKEVRDWLDKTEKATGLKKSDYWYPHELRAEKQGRREILTHKKDCGQPREMS